MNFVFLMDPLETVCYEKDTTLLLMIGACARNNTVYHLKQGGICIKNGKVFFKVVEVVAQRNSSQPFIVRDHKEICEDMVDVVFIRTDPPFDEKYLMDTWLLDRLPKRIAVINSPTGIRTVNEKLWVTRFGALTPLTVVTRDKKDFMEFLNAQNEIIVKPVNLYGGSSIFYVQKNDLNANVIFETVSQQQSRDVILQKYIPEARQGDKRIILLNGEPLGAVLRLHAENDHRNNFFSGGQAHAATIDASDERIIKELKPYLLSLGLYFVGIDIIGQYLIEVNVTSPTCLQEISRLDQKKLETEVITFAEELALKNQKGVL